LRRQLLKRVTGRNTESAENQADQAISGKHDEHTEQAPKDLPFALLPFIIGGLGTNELKNTPEENHESDRKCQIDNRVQYKLIDFIEEIRDIHPA